MKTGMKQTEIGLIPADWKLVALGEISDRAKTKNDGGEYEILTISAKTGFVRQADKYSRYMAGKSVENYTLLKSGEFAYNKGNSLTYPFGCIYRLDDHDEALVPSVYISFKLRGGIDSQFCKHLFLEGSFIGRLEKYITSGVRGNGLLNVNAEDFFSLKLALPPLPEQQKIAEILSTVDEQIANIEEQLTQTQELKKGLMQRLMTKGIGHTAFKNSPLGSVPVSWNILTLAQVASVERGKFQQRPRNDPRFYGGQYPFVQTGDVVRANGKITAYSQTLNELGLSVSRLFPAGTIVITIAANIGDVAIAQFEVAFPDSLVGIIPSASQIDGRFLLYYLATQKEALNELAPQSAQKNINLDTLRPYPIPTPPLPEQRQIAEILSTVDDKLSVLTEKKAHYQTLKKGLMQQLLMGQRRVQVAEVVAVEA